MAHLFVSDFREGINVKQFFLIRQVELRTTRKNRPYLDLVLADKSGTIKAKVWEDVLEKCLGPFKAGDYVGVAGQVTAYQDEFQLGVTFISTVEDLRARGKELPEFDPDLLHQASPYDRQMMWREVWEMAETGLDAPLKSLVLNLLARYQDEIMVCPAARRLHHAYLGGLLEHTWTVTRHARQSLAVYPELHGGLVLAGAMLHDLGKVKELANPQAPAMTVPGQLLGHIVLGWEMVREEARILQFPDVELLMQLEHIILSHHGSLEFGSPVTPKTREALLIYYLDDLDAKLKMMEQHLQEDSGDTPFTRYHRTLQRDLYKPPQSQAESPDEPGGDGELENPSE